MASDSLTVEMMREKAEKLAKDVTEDFEADRLIVALTLLAAEVCERLDKLIELGERNYD